jgi:hypothetical protein
MTNADDDPETVLQGCLHLMVGSVRGRLAIVLQPLAHRFAQFRWMSMPPIVEGDFSSPANFVQQTVGR